MNERVTDQQIRQATGLAVDSHRPGPLGNGIRIDPPHGAVINLGQGGDSPSLDDRIASLSAGGMTVHQGPEAAAAGRLQQSTSSEKNVGNHPRLDTRFLNDFFQQLHLQIQSEKDDLESRELALREQQSVFQAEKQRLVQEITVDFAEIQDQKSQLLKTETVLAERQIELELQSRQVESERELLRIQRIEVEQKKQSVRGEVLAELQSEREESDRLRTTLREEHDRVQLLKGWLQQRLDEVAAENERTLQAEREKLWQSLTTEWEQRQASFQQERDAWVTLRDLERSEIDREKALFDSTVESANAEFLATREAVAGELANLRDQQTQQLFAEQDEWNQRREQEQAELLAMRQSIETEIAESRAQQAEMQQNEVAAWEELRRREEFELRAARESLDAELSSLREQHAEKLLAERTEWEQSLESEKRALSAQHAEWLREQTLVENRIRFQQDHLDKCRFEFEHAQNEHRHERQVERQRIEEAGLIMIRRLRQIDLYRSSIDEREKSLDREQELFQRTQKAISSKVELDRKSFESERDAWEHERQIQQAELRRQKEAVAALSESLEGRRTRLDKLRAELEETHRATLEMRLAVEETWAQLTQTAGQDDARARVEEVRASLVGYYQQMHDSLEAQRREQLEFLEKFERQRLEFAEERQKLTDWFTARDEELKLSEERLRTEANAAESNHAQWLAARDQWLLEKAEAEKLIRRLLASLGDTNREQSREDGTVLSLNDIAVATES